ncbi:MAG: hypothetical protein EA350_12615 [Gemmatimonadales bacterium]|nr:MAG: hypothetical protein EA350_12615 [Gemmatimonadales bacterium]
MFRGGSPHDGHHPPGGRRVPAVSPRGRSLARALSSVLLAGLVACGEGGPPPPEFPGLEGPRGPTELTVAIEVTFTRDEAPVRVPRTVVIRLEGNSLSDDPVLLEAALEALAAGPTEEEEARGITSFFSEETSDLVREVTLVGDSASVDFRDLASVIPNVSSSAGSFLFLSELNGTVFGLPGIARVEYRMDGSCEAFWSFLQRSCQEVRRPADA